ncbi:hypothetical protein GW17_00001706, partial [Ensete ventricosum]
LSGRELLSGEKEGLLQLPSDKALLTDSVFRPFVDKYAADEEAFFSDYAEAHLKLSELGYALKFLKSQTGNLMKLVKLTCVFLDHFSDLLWLEEWSCGSSKTRGFEVLSTLYNHQKHLEINFYGCMPFPVVVDVCLIPDFCFVTCLHLHQHLQVSRCHCHLHLTFL